MKYFKECNTFEELKKEYRRLVKINHPDCGGDLAIMKDINNEYEEAYKSLEKSYDKAESNSEEKRSYATNEEIKSFMNIIQALAKFENINIEIIGTWLWVGGDTKPIKQELFNVGLRWAKIKKMWYWHEGEYKQFKRKREYSLSEIRNKYGSKKVDFSADDKKSIHAK